MSALPVINPAEFLPLPLAVEALDYPTLMTGWKARFVALWPDYDVAGLESDPGVKVAEVYAYLRLLDRARVNDVYRTLRLPLAERTDLDGLAADRGVKRLVYVPADPATGAPAVLEGDVSLLLRTWLVMQTWGSGSPWGVEYHARTLGLQNVADCHVIDHPGEGRMTCVVLPVPGLADDDKAAMLSAIGSGLMVRSRRPGAVWIDTIEAEIVTVDYAGTLAIRRGASPAATLAKARTGLSAYMATRRRIGARVPRSAMEAAQYSHNVVEAAALSPPGDVLIGETQAAELGAVTIAPEVVDD